MASVKPNSTPQKTAGVQTFIPKSSWLAMLEYDQENLRLTTHLKSGAIYQHIFVLPGDWMELQTSKNASSFWTKRIKGVKQSVTVKTTKMPNSEIKLGR